MKLLMAATMGFFFALNFSGYSWAAELAPLQLGEKAPVVPQPAPPVWSGRIPTEADVFSRLSVIAPIANFGVGVWADPKGSVPEGLVFTGAALEKEADYAFLAKLGVKTVISLQAVHQDDAGSCAKYGLDCVQYEFLASPLSSFSGSDSFQKAFLRLAAGSTAGTKTYVHCLAGFHRTGALVSAVVIRNAACGKKFDKEALCEEVENALTDRYGYTGGFAIILAKWHSEVLSWVDNFEKNQWLCR